MAGKSSTWSRLGWPRVLAVAVLATVACWFFPLFHLRPLASPSGPAGAVDVAAAAAKFWNEQLPSARADDAAVVAGALRSDATAAIKRHARIVGLGAAYFFVSGEGRIVTTERNRVRLVLGDAADAPMVELQTGPIFGNTVRDATGLLDVNRFSSLQDFNSLAAELNQRVESLVLPALRERARVGARVVFTGGAEAVEPMPGAPLLSIVPMRAELR